MKRKPETFVEWLGHLLGMVVIVIALGLLAVLMVVAVLVAFDAVFAGFASPIAALAGG